MSDAKDDIEKYLHGELTPAEMHLLEKKALHDPFLAEALEGGGSLHAEDFSRDIDEINQALQRRIERKADALWLWSARVAAGLIILVVTGYVVFRLMDENTTKTDLALNTNESFPKQLPSGEILRPDSQVVVVPKINNEASSPILPTPQPAEKAMEEKDIPLSEEAPVEELSPQPEPVEKLGPAEELAQDAQPKLEDDAEQSKVYVKREDESKKMKSVASNAPTPSMRMKKELKILQGKVIDEDGSPMPGVNVALKGSDVGAVTDVEGNYKLSLDQDTKGELIFSFIGMQNAEISIVGKDSINAKLSPDMAELSEVVVTGYGSKNDENTREDINVYQPASPEGGKKAYRNYLIQNLKYPQQAIVNKVEGKVTIQFMVDTNGNFHDFKIIKGIGYGCDDEVIRLIEQGPKWIPTKRNDIPTSGKVKVRLKFTLPD